MDIWHALWSVQEQTAVFFVTFILSCYNKWLSESADNLKRMSHENAWVVPLKSHVHYDILLKLLIT